MKRMKGIQYLAIIFLAMLFTISCGSGTQNKQEGQTSESSSDPDAYTFEKFLEDAKDLELGTTAISGIHQYFVMAKVDYFQEMCNSSENVSRYLDSYPLAAANLGVYFADLLYHTYGRATENTVNTTNVILELSDYLGLENDMYENLLARYDDNVAPVDSTLVFWHALMKDSEKYNSEKEKIFVKSAILLGNNIEKFYLISSLVQTPFRRELTSDEATMAKKQLTYFLMNLETRVASLQEIFEAQKEQLQSLFLLDELAKLHDVAATVTEKGDAILALDAPGIMSSPELDALHTQILVIRTAIVDYNK